MSGLEVEEAAGKKKTIAASAIWYSFLRYYLGGGAPQFIGLANYVDCWVTNASGATCSTPSSSSALSVACSCLVGLALALALYAATRGVRLISLLNFLPNVVTPVVGGDLPEVDVHRPLRLLDATLIWFDVYPPNWLGDPVWAKMRLILADTWKFMPFLMLVLYAGLQAFDTQLLEAAQIDGANAWQRLRYVILPTMKPLILFVVAIRAMDAFRFFDLVYVITNGGPGTATETVTLYTYQIGFRHAGGGQGVGARRDHIDHRGDDDRRPDRLMSRRGREAF